MKKIQEAELAQKFGAIPIEDGWNKYQLNGWEIWKCIHVGLYCKWAIARLVDDRWVDHSYFDSLNSAFEAVSEPALID